MRSTDPKHIRRKIIEFIQSEGGIADRTSIKEHLGLDPMTYYGYFNRALKTTKLVPIYGSGKIGSGLVLRRKPIIAYRLATS